MEITKDGKKIRIVYNNKIIDLIKKNALKVLRIPLNLKFKNLIKIILKEKMLN